LPHAAPVIGGSMNMLHLQFLRLGAWPGKKLIEAKFSKIFYVIEKFPKKLAYYIVL